MVESLEVRGTNIKAKHRPEGDMRATQGLGGGASLEEKEWGGA